MAAHPRTRAALFLYLCLVEACREHYLQSLEATALRGSMLHGTLGMAGHRFRREEHLLAEGATCRDTGFGGGDLRRHLDLLLNLFLMTPLLKRHLFTCFQQQKRGTTGSKYSTLTSFAVGNKKTSSPFQGICVRLFLFRFSTSRHTRRNIGSFSLSPSGGHKTLSPMPPRIRETLFPADCQGSGCTRDSSNANERLTSICILNDPEEVRGPHNNHSKPFL